MICQKSIGIWSRQLKMILSQQSVTKLSEIICGNSLSKNRTKRELVAFFNMFGFQDEYGTHLPSRESYTLDRLGRINGTPEIDKCIIEVFNPRNFIPNLKELDDVMIDFNSYLEFDGWCVSLEHATIKILKAIKISVVEAYKNEKTEELKNAEDAFLEKVFPRPNFYKLKFESGIQLSLNHKLDELDICVHQKCSLASVILAGSILEGVLLFFAFNHSDEFMKSKKAPQDKSGNVKKIEGWDLYTLIEVSHSCGFIDQDIIKFSHALRGYRNFIHPSVQFVQGFTPSIHTAEMCYQVVLCAINQLIESA